MLTVGAILPAFEIVGVKPGFMEHTEDGVSAFQPIDDNSFPDQWKLIYFYPKDFTFVCPTEIAEFSRLAPEFEARNCVVLGGSSDNEFCKLAWRRAHPDLTKLNHWSFADPNGAFAALLGVRSHEGVALRATVLVDPAGVIQHVSVNGLDVGRSPAETLRVLDAAQTGALCPSARPLGGDTLAA